ncbi:MAG TPA: ATP-binding protein [Alphaproteobacteria bacterium]|jgi:predicted kinase|nr:ATP-binding protein [Alphaproteobacteria bacterium]
MTTLHFIYGKPAAGKTTLARRLATEYRAALFIEDEWLVLLEAEINSLADYVRHARRLRAALAPHVIRLLQLGVPVVFDFAANTPKDRAWVRSIFEAANADHMLHVIEASDAFCKERLRQRNEAKPDGVYYGEVSEATYDAVTRHIVPPSDDEGFGVTRYDAEAM